MKFDWNISSNILSGYKSYFSKNQKYSIHNFRLSFYKIEQKIKNGKFDAVLVLGWNNLHYLKAIYYAIKLKKILILRSENNLLSESSFLKKQIKYFYFKIFFLKNKLFFKIGTLNKNFYLFHNVDKKILDAPYFVDNKFFKSQKKKMN